MGILVVHPRSIPARTVGRRSTSPTHACACCSLRAGLALADHERLPCCGTDLQMTHMLQCCMQQSRPKPTIPAPPRAFGRGLERLRSAESDSKASLCRYASLACLEFLCLLILRRNGFHHPGLSTFPSHRRFRSRDCLVNFWPNCKLPGESSTERAPKQQHPRDQQLGQSVAQTPKEKPSTRPKHMHTPLNLNTSTETSVSKQPRLSFRCTHHQNSDWIRYPLYDKQAPASTCTHADAQELQPRCFHQLSCFWLFCVASQHALSSSSNLLATSGSNSCKAVHLRLQADQTSTADPTFVQHKRVKCVLSRLQCQHGVVPESAAPAATSWSSPCLSSPDLKG